MIFSDESKIDLHPSHPVPIRRPIGQSRYHPKYTAKTIKHRGGSIMVWGAIWANGKRVLVKVDGTLTSQKYVQILERHLLPIMGPNDIFQQDGAPAHTSHLFKSFMEENGVALLPEWPAQSPDLNIIENMWVELKKRVKDQNPRTVGDLWLAAEKAFYEIPDNFIKNLFESIERRIECCVRRKGHPTRF